MYINKIINNMFSGVEFKLEKKAYRCNELYIFEYEWYVEKCR